MYLHLGKNISVDTNDIIAILDLDNISIAKHSREFLRIAEEEGFVRSVADDIPKSVVVCEINNQSVVYITNISSRTLAGRAKRRYIPHAQLLDAD
ncbi:MAG: DUF370 domain-containing protein [Clostridiales bacterium]|nr:DUF370 domain-containing protein [Clostridiales bacterium]